jgi:hypothetical protein
MQSVYKNEEVLTLTSGSYIIHDASVTKFDIYTLEHRLYVDVYFTSIASKRIVQTKFKLSFIDVLEYSFCWNANYGFYNVESYKFLKLDKGFYISLDPVDGSDELSDDDKDIILSKEVEGCFI